MHEKVKVKFCFRRGALGQWYSDEFFDMLEGRYQVVIDDHNPDFVFHETHIVDVTKYSGVRIGFSGENVRPDFNISDYAIGFDHMRFQDRYLRYPLYLLYSNCTKAAENRPNSILCIDELSLVNRKFCNFLVSNGSATEFRTQFFHLLSEYHSVDSGGSYLNNIGKTVEDKIAWQQEHKFSLCFENSSTSGYLTEKLIQAYAANTIPIYWGDPDAFGSLGEGKGGINPEAVVWVDPKYPELSIRHIMELDSDPNLYLAMLKKPLFVDLNHAGWFEDSLRDFLCAIFDQNREAAYRRGFGQIRLRVEKRNIARSSWIKSLISFIRKRIRL